MYNTNNNAHIIRVKISNDITRLHIKYQFILKYSKNISRQIYNHFYKAFLISPNLLEDVKTDISSEEHDLKDLTDLLNDLYPEVKNDLLNLFVLNYSMSSRYLYHTQVITDLDCTLFENVKIAESIYGGDGNVVLGVFPLLKTLTRNGKTCLTVITARPSAIETHSLIANRKRLSQMGVKHYSFQSGELDGTIHFLKSQALRKLGGSFEKVADKELKLSSLLFASLKYKCYKRLKEAYPFSQFIFTGDDAQGDYIFASLLVKDNPRNFAFIRKTLSLTSLSKNENNTITPFSSNLWPTKKEFEKIFGLFVNNYPDPFDTMSSPRILHVDNFYEAIYKAPVDVILDCEMRKQAYNFSISESIFLSNIISIRPVERYWINLFVSFMATF